jgi:hypothetical protein
MTALAPLLVLATALAPQAAPWSVAPARPKVGDRVVASTTVATRAGEEVRLARPCDVDAAFAQVDPVVEPATDGRSAQLTLEMVAGAPGRFELGPFALRVGAPGREQEGGREIETAPLALEIARDGLGDDPVEFGPWRRPLRAAPEGGGALRTALIVAAACAALAIGWIVGRRRLARARPRVPAAAVAPVDWRRELARLAAAIPSELEARRAWWRELSEVVRGELARRRPRDSLDRTSEELARDGGADGSIGEARVRLLGRLDDGKFARATLDVDAAHAAADAASTLLGSGS